MPQWKEWWEDDWDTWRDQQRVADGHNQGGRGYYGGPSVQSKHIRMAVALRAARSLAGVLDTNTEEKMTVDFLSEGDPNVGLTFLNKGMIRVSAAPLLTYKTDQEFSKAVEAINGEVLHEVGHSVGTRKRLNSIKKVENQASTQNEKNLVRHLGNILEDNLIEKEQVALNPGFEKYLHSTKKWLGQDSGLMDGDHQLPPWDAAGLTERLQYVGDLLRYKEWSDRWQAIPAEETEFWEDLNDRYLKGTEKRSEILLDAFNHIRQNVPPDQQKPTPAPGDGEHGTPGEPDYGNHGPVEDGPEQDGSSPSEAESGGEEPGEGKEQGTRVDPLMGHRCLGNMMKPLSKVDKELIDALVSEEIEYDPDHRVVITKPKISRSFKTEKTAEVARLVGMIRARPTKFAQPESLKRRGTVDQNQLYRIFQDPVDLRVFRQNAIPRIPHARIYLLADGSGSMGFEERAVVFNTSLMMIHAFKDIKVTTKVFGYTDAGNGVQIYRIWEPGDEFKRLSVVHTAEAGGTPTGEALAWLHDRLGKEAEPDESKIIIVLSDGAPNSTDNTRQAVLDARRKGISVLEVAVGHWSEGAQEQMFGKGNYIPFAVGGRNGGSPISKLARWLSKEI